jgi:hypothetical protein
MIHWTSLLETHAYLLPLIARGLARSNFALQNKNGGFLKMLCLRVLKTLHTETRTSKGGATYCVKKILVDNPYFDGQTVHPSTKVLWVSCSSEFKFRHDEGPNFVFINMSKDGRIFINGNAI